MLSVARLWTEYHYHLEGQTENLKLTAQGSKQVGYIGKKRYVRANFVSGSATLSVFGVLGHPTRVPTIGYLADHQFPKDV